MTSRRVIFRNVSLSPRLDTKDNWARQMLIWIRVGPNCNEFLGEGLKKVGEVWYKVNMKSFFFYDLETSGLLAREDRIMQFAGQRTDMELNPIGEPENILIKMKYA